MPRKEPKSKNNNQNEARIEKSRFVLVYPLEAINHMIPITYWMIAKLDIHLCLKCHPRKTSNQVFNHGPCFLVIIHRQVDKCLNGP